MRTGNPVLMAIFTRVAGMVMLLALVGCGGDSDSDGEADEACKIVCDKSEACGGAPADCMSSCKSDPPSGACLDCYKLDSCSDVGACYNSTCKDDNGNGNISEVDCARICDKMSNCGGEQTMEDCMARCRTRTVVDDCLGCPDIEECTSFWSCISEYECWHG